MHLENTMHWRSELYKGKDSVSQNVNSIMPIIQADCEVCEMQGAESIVFDFSNINMYIEHMSLNVLS